MPTYICLFWVLTFLPSVIFSWPSPWDFVSSWFSLKVLWLPTTNLGTIIHNFISCYLRRITVFSWGCPGSRCRRDWFGQVHKCLETPVCCRWTCGFLRAGWTWWDSPSHSMHLSQEQVRDLWSVIHPKWRDDWDLRLLCPDSKERTLLIQQTWFCVSTWWTCDPLCRLLWNWHWPHKSNDIR